MHGYVRGTTLRVRVRDSVGELDNGLERVALALPLLLVLVVVRDVVPERDGEVLMPGLLFVTVDVTDRVAARVRVALLVPRLRLRVRVALLVPRLRLRVRVALLVPGLRLLVDDDDPVPAIRLAMMDAVAVADPVTA